MTSMHSAARQVAATMARRRTLAVGLGASELVDAGLASDDERELVWLTTLATCVVATADAWESRERRPALERTGQGPRRLSDGQSVSGQNDLAPTDPAPIGVPEMAVMPAAPPMVRDADEDERDLAPRSRRRSGEGPSVRRGPEPKDPRSRGAGRIHGSAGRVRHPLRIPVRG